MATCEDCCKEYTPRFQGARFCGECRRSTEVAPEARKAHDVAVTPSRRALSLAKQRHARIMQARGLSDAEIAERLGVQVKTVRRWRAEGALPERREG